MAGEKLILLAQNAAAIPELRNLSDNLKVKYNQNSVFLLYSNDDKKLSFIVSCSKDMTAQGFSAATFIKDFAAAFSGKANFAQGGGIMPENNLDIIDKAKETLSKLV